MFCSFSHIKKRQFVCKGAIWKHNVKKAHYLWQILFSKDRVSSILYACPQCGLVTLLVTVGVCAPLTLNLGRLVFLGPVENGGGNHSWICELIFLTQLGKFLTIISLHISSVSFPFSSSSGMPVTYTTWSGPTDIRCFNPFFHSFFLCVLVWAISTDLS